MSQHEAIAIDVMHDDGCPNHCEGTICRRVILPDLFRDFSRTNDFHRRHRVVIHLTMIGLIVISLLADGSFKSADWLFVALSVLCEVSA